MIFAGVTILIATAIVYLDQAGISAVTIKIRLPAGDWEPRDHQRKLWGFLEGGGTRAIAVWHRRAGKDDVVLHHTACAAHKRVGNYWHCMPEYAQCRKAIWTAVNPHSGKRRIDEAFPHEIRESTNEQRDVHPLSQRLDLVQAIGSDNYNAQMGAPRGWHCLFRMGAAHPGAWGFHRPILEENNGWAASSPRRAVVITPRRCTTRRCRRPAGLPRS